MPVFSSYFKVLRATLPSMLIYLVIFLGITLIFSLTSSPMINNGFQPTATPVTVINRDVDSPLVQGLVDHLAKTNQLRNYPDDPERLQDALFFRNIQYVAIIPAGFSEAMLQGGPANLEKVVVPDALATHSVDLSVDQYLNTVRRYLQFGAPDDWTQLLAQVEQDLSQQTPVVLTETEPKAVRRSGYYFGYLAYAQLSLVLLGVSSVMLVFNRPDLQQRNRCAPLSRRRFNLQMAAGHGLFAFGTWLLLMLVALALYRQELAGTGLIRLLALNSLLFTSVCVSVALLIGGLVKNSNAQSAVVNMLTLGMSFLTGVFMPQSLLCPKVLAIAKFLPSYWYVRANDAISAADRLSTADLSTIYPAMLLQLGFAIAIFSVGLLLSKERQRA